MMHSAAYWCIDMSVGIEDLGGTANSVRSRSARYEDRGGRERFKVLLAFTVEGSVLGVVA